MRIVRMPRPADLGSRMTVVASLREETPSFEKAEERWLLTVLSARKSCEAIAALVIPITTRPRICFSRTVSRRGAARAPNW
jgi:hypothetical protein